MATIGGIDPQFTGPNPGGDPPYARTPAPQQLFAKRAKRFAALAADSPIGDYLSFLGRLAAAQHAAVESATLPALPDTVAVSLANGMPALPRTLAATAEAASVLDVILDQLSEQQLPDGPAAVVRTLAASAPEARARMLELVAEGVFDVDRLGESAIAAAALQVWFALHAAQIDGATLRNIGENLCPCCGAAPVSSTIVDWPQANGNRYLTCSLCCTMWNMIRVKCTACGSEQGISYRSVEGSTGDIAAEVCESCQGYSKHLLLTKNAALDPVADDVASYGLDMMLSEDGWHRTGLNPFLVLAP